MTVTKFRAVIRALLLLSSYAVIGFSQAAAQVVTPTCPTGYVLSRGQCVRGVAQTPTCPSGFVFSQGQCVVRGAAPTSSCPTGYVLTQGQCLRTTTPAAQQEALVCFYNSRGDQRDADGCKIGWSLSQKGSTTLSPLCRQSSGAVCAIGNSGPCRPGSSKHSQYVVFDRNTTDHCPPTFRQAGGGPQTVAPTCPSGFVFSGGQCVRNTAPAPNCPSGFTFYQGQCVRTATPAPPVVSAPPPAVNLAFPLQSELKRLGCLTGSVDGVWGRGSRAALARFAGRAGLRLGSEPSQAALAEAQRRAAGFCAPVYVGPKTRPGPVKKVRCSKIKFAFTRGNSCACSGGRIFTGRACVRPQQQASPQQCIKRCDAIGAQCDRKLTQLGDAQGWDGDLRRDYWENNCAPKVNSCKVGCNPKGPIRPGECRYMADGSQVCS